MSNRHLFFGLILVVSGTVMLVDRLTPFELGAGWPLVFIVFGLWKLIAPRAPAGAARPRRFGAWLLFVGFWGLVNEMRLFGLDYDTSWPVMVVGVGLMLVWRSFDGPVACRRLQER